MLSVTVQTASFLVAEDLKSLKISRKKNLDRAFLRCYNSIRNGAQAPVTLWALSSVG